LAAGGRSAAAARAGASTSAAAAAHLLAQQQPGKRDDSSGESDGGGQEREREDCLLASIESLVGERVAGVGAHLGAGVAAAAKGSFAAQRERVAAEAGEAAEADAAKVGSHATTPTSVARSDAEDLPLRVLWPEGTEAAGRGYSAAALALAAAAGAPGEVSLSFPAGAATAGGGGVVTVHETFSAAHGYEQHATFVLPVPAQVILNPKP
jgi:hypothetical protein